MRVKLLIALILGIALIAYMNNSKSKEDEELTELDIQVEVKSLTNHVDESLKGKSPDDCKCFNGIGSTEGDKPINISTFSNGTSISLCGFFDKEIQGKGLIMYGFNAFNSETGKTLVEYGGVQTCRIEKRY